MSAEMLVSAVRSTADRAGVFEYDGSSGYFYLWDMAASGGSQIVGAVLVLNGPPDFVESDVDVRWSSDEAATGLFIRGLLWAAFSGESGIGGDYRPGAVPDLPRQLCDSF